MSTNVLVYSIAHMVDVERGSSLVRCRFCLYILRAMLVNEAVLDFLPTQEVARLALVSRAHALLLKEQKSVLRSVWHGDMPASHRPLFWQSYLPISE